MSNHLFPLFVDIAGHEVLVVGGGAVAQRKVEALLHAGARVCVGAPSLVPALATLRDASRIEHIVGEFEPRWLEDAWLVIAATDDRDINRVVAAEARERRLFVNVVDDAELSSFHVPALVERGPLKIAISSGGGAPMLARHLREWLETVLDERWGGLAEYFVEQRQRIRRRLPDLAQRRRWFAGLWSRGLPGQLESVSIEQVEASLRRLDPRTSLGIDSGASQGKARAGASLRIDSGALLREGSTGASPRIDTGASRRDATALGSCIATNGRVLLVGAGPGDPGLLTLRALRALNEADVILHDRLVSDTVLRMARRDAERIEVGKTVGDDHHATQARIHALMIEHARAGKTVIRLKGGDPFVFGRGGEELEALRAAGIAYEVVPGITAALACAAYAGIPLTHRAHAQSVRFVAARCATQTLSFDAGEFSDPRETLAVYMGTKGLERFRARLLASGRTSATPCVLIENGSRPEQRVLVGTIADIAEIARAYAVEAPALLVVGDVAALATRLHWFGAPPIVAAQAPEEEAIAQAA